MPQLDASDAFASQSTRRRASVLGGTDQPRQMIIFDQPRLRHKSQAARGGTGDMS